MDEKTIQEYENKYEYGTKEYFDVSLRSMINSVYCYDNYGNDHNKYLNNKYIQNYYLDKSYCDGKGRLTKEEVEKIVKEQVDYLCKHATIIHDVYVDSEDVVYNSLEFYD